MPSVTTQKGFHHQKTGQLPNEIPDQFGHVRKFRRQRRRLSSHAIGCTVALPIIRFEIKRE
jgi:hypothetical protein